MQNSLEHTWHNDFYLGCSCPQNSLPPIFESEKMYFNSKEENTRILEQKRTSQFFILKKVSAPSILSIWKTKFKTLWFSISILVQFRGSTEYQIVFSLLFFWNYSSISQNSSSSKKCYKFLSELRIPEKTWDVTWNWPEAWACAVSFNCAKHFVAWDGMLNSWKALRKHRHPII